MDNENRLDSIEERLDLIESKLEELFDHLDLTSEHDEDYDNDFEDENDDEICDDCYDDPCACLPEDYDYEDDSDDEDEDESDDEDDFEYDEGDEDDDHDDFDDEDDDEDFDDEDDDEPYKDENDWDSSDEDDDFDYDYDDEDEDVIDGDYERRRRHKTLNQIIVAGANFQRHSLAVKDTMISKKEYKELKAYWDYQRKVEYNREVMRDEMNSAEESYHIELLDKEELFDYLWNEIDPEDYVNPPKFWIPINEKYQIEGESERKNIKRRK